MSKRAKELKEQGIEIVAVHASKIEKDTLDEWLKENRIEFPVGIIKSEEEQTRINWGVESLPWLILTDENNIVTAEGFSISEFDEIHKIDK